MVPLIFALLVSIPAEAPEMSATIPYSENLKEEFEKKANEMIQEIKGRGCLRGTLSANADDNVRVITLTLRCLEWRK